MNDSNIETAVKRILLIEDDDDSALIVQGLIGRNPRGFQIEWPIVWANNLSAGLEHLAAGAFDLVLLDLDLPDSAGFDTFHRLNQQNPDVAVVILTGNEDEEEALRALQQGAQDYLLKREINGRMLTRAVGYALERKRAELALRRANETLESQVELRTAELRDALTMSRQLARNLVEAQEDERRRIARELHDEAGQISSSPI